MKFTNVANGEGESGRGPSGKFKFTLVALAGIVVGLALWRVLPVAAAHTKVQWKFGGQTLNLDVRKDMSDPEALIKKLMSRPFSKAGALALLRKNGIYSITSPAIVPALQELCPAQGPTGETLPQRRQRLQACLDKGVVKSLRELASQHEPPFQYIGREVIVGTPPDPYEPKVGEASVCADGGFVGRRIEIDDLLGQRRVTVRATHYYDCTHLSIVPDIQLSAQDAFQLFGRPTRRYEKAVAVIL